MIRLALWLMLLSSAAFAQTTQTFPAYVTSRSPATTPLSGQCFPLSNGTTTTKLCSGYAAAIGALSATNNLSDLGNPATARLNLFNGVSFGALSRCLGLDNNGNVISGPCTLQTMGPISLSNTSVIGGAPGATVGTISVAMSPASPAFAGTLSVDDTVHFSITGSTLNTNGSLASGSYPINITAAEPTSTTNSPFTQVFTIAVQTLQSVTLSNNTIVGGQPSGTIVGAITVALSPSSPPFSGSLLLSGSGASSFQIIGSNLATQGIVNNGTYSVNVIASQGGAQISQAVTISVIPQSISQVILSNTSVIGGTGSANEFVGNVHVIMAPAAPAFSGSLAITGTNASSFILSGSALNVSGSNISNGSYSLNIVATQGNATGSPFIQAETITAATTTWVNDQTQLMPYVCLNQIWINPSASSSGSLGGGKLFSSGGHGTQAAPFLTMGDIYASQIAISPGTCVNLANTATLYDSQIFGNGSGISHPLNLVGIFTNAPDGWWAIRSTDNTGAPVAAAAIGGSLNSSAATWVSTNLALGNNIGQIAIQPPTDYVILDGINFWMDGAQRTQLEQPCINVGSLPGNNVQGGLTHFDGRNNYVHGCGLGGFNVGGSDYVAVRNNVIKTVAISEGEPNNIQESGISVGASASANGYVPAGYDNSLCTTMNGLCQPYHQIISGNLVSDAFEALVAQTTDGNCIIIDTNIAPTSSNAGAYLYRMLIVNNVVFNCGGRGITSVVSQHMDVVNNTSVKNFYDLHNQGSTGRGGLLYIDVEDNYIVNNIEYMLGADTTITTTTTGTSIHVNDVSGFMSNGAGPSFPPNSGSPLSITVDGIANGVIGVTTDQTNTSTSPGGISGTLTLNTSVSSPHGNSGVSVLGVNVTGNNTSQNSPLIWNIQAFQAGGSPVTTCVNWAQPPPCSPANQYQIVMNDSSAFWYNNLLQLVNNNIVPNNTPGTAFCSDCAQPPTTGSPGNNLLFQDPSLTTTFYSVSPDYEMTAITVLNNGSSCTAGEVITLSGGSPDSSDNAKVQVLSASSGHIVNSNLFHTGRYLSNSTTTFTEGSTTGSCAGVSFSSARFVQTLVSTSTPNVVLQGGSPAINAGNSNFCPTHNFFGSTRSCPPNIGAY